MATEETPGTAKAATKSKTAGPRKLASASNATAYVLLTIGAVVLINLIGTRVFGRLDLTENHVYTLAPGSKALVANLPDYLTVKAYISKNDLPPELQSVARYTKDLLDDYRTYSKGKLIFQVFDPTDDKKIEDEAAQCKVQKLQVQVMRSQKFEVGTHYLGICFQYQGKDEAIPQAGQVEGLEYRISSLIKRMTQKKQKVAITNGHGEGRARLPEAHRRVRGHQRQPVVGADSRRRRRVDRPRAEATVRRQGPPRDRRFPDEGQGRGLHGRRHGDAGAAQQHAARDDGRFAQDRAAQRHRPQRAAREVRLQDRPGLHPRPAEGPRSGRPARRPQDARQRPRVRRREDGRGEGPVDPRAHRRARVPVRELGGAGRPARRWQAAGGQAVDDRQDHADGVEAHRDVLLLADGQDRRGEGQGRRSASPTRTRARSRAPTRRRRRSRPACPRPISPARRRPSRRSRCACW